MIPNVVKDQIWTGERDSIAIAHVLSTGKESTQQSRPSRYSESSGQRVSTKGSTLPDRSDARGPQAGARRRHPNGRPVCRQGHELLRVRSLSLHGWLQ